MSAVWCAKAAFCQSVVFLLAIDWIMRKAIGNKKRGIRWLLASLLEDLDFVDDVVL